MQTHISVNLTIDELQTLIENSINKALTDHLPEQASPQEPQKK